MPEEIESQITSKPAGTPEMVAEIPPTEEKPTKPWLKITLFSVLGIFVFAGAVFGAYKLGQKQVQPGPQPTPGSGEKVYCEEPRPEVCTLECIQNPPYICGSDGKSYCSECQACANPKVKWYVIQNEACGIE